MAHQLRNSLPCTFLLAARHVVGFQPIAVSRGCVVCSSQQTKAACALIYPPLRHSARPTATPWSREEDADEAVQAIIRSTKARIERNELSSNVVDVDTVSAVVAELTSREQDLTDSSTQMQSAFLRPRLYFDPVRNTLLL